MVALPLGGGTLQHLHQAILDELVWALSGVCPVELYGVGRLDLREVIHEIADRGLLVGRQHHVLPARVRLVVLGLCGDLRPQVRGQHGALALLLDGHMRAVLLELALIPWAELSVALTLLLQPRVICIARVLVEVLAVLGPQGEPLVAVVAEVREETVEEGLQVPGAGTGVVEHALARSQLRQCRGGEEQGEGACHLWEALNRRAARERS
mmetsp:Transcript_86870/g.270083  ORF Transcript_86870/g.270083 Transcript_86870/m.270083 type:complete len:210 (-) Transcript_86870:19-648(-)